jgi:hypothetical protein
LAYTLPHGFLHPPEATVAAAAERVAPLGDCLMCGRPVATAAEHLRLRGDLVVHTACATYQRRRSRPRKG